MQSCVGISCCRRCGVAAIAVTAASCSRPSLTRAYSAPTYPVNSTDLPDPRGTKSEAWQQQQQQQQQSPYASTTTTPRGRGSVDGSDGQHPFTKLDLQNPPQMPSPAYYGTYEEYLDAYDHYLRETEHFTTSARAFVQRRFQKMRVMQANVADVVRREYLWTFLPLVFCLSVFMIDRSNHSAASFTHRVIKERTKQQVKHVKWESV